MKITEQQAELILGLIARSPGIHAGPEIEAIYLPLVDQMLQEFPTLANRGWTRFGTKEQSKIITPERLVVGKTYKVWYPYNGAGHLDVRNGERITVYEGCGENYSIEGYGGDTWDEFYFNCNGVRIAVRKENLSRLVQLANEENVVE